MGEFTTCVSYFDSLTNYMDNCLAPFTLVDDTCSTIFDPLCFAAAKTGAIIQELEEAKIKISDVPATKAMVKLMAKTYYSDIYGLRHANIAKEEVQYTKEEIDIIAKTYADLKDDMASEKLIRILRVGSCDYQITPNIRYRTCNRLPFFIYCYGGSYSQGLRIADYMQDVGVPFGKLHGTMLDLDTQWHNYIQTFIIRTIYENPIDVHRMTTGEHIDKSIGKTIEQLKNSEAYREYCSNPHSSLSNSVFEENSVPPSVVSSLQITFDDRHH